MSPKIIFAQLLVPRAFAQKAPDSKSPYLRNAARCASVHLLGGIAVATHAQSASAPGLANAANRA